MKYLLLWLEGTLQSWGVNSLFYRRASLPFPTKSGILGMICSATGRKDEQGDFLTEFIPLKQSVVSYKKNNFSSLTLIDFHMVGSGYNVKDSWQNMCIPKTFKGENAVGGGAKLTYRYYLVDSFFSVILEVPDCFENEITRGFFIPVFDICLGRKNCPPSDMVFRGFFDSLEKAFLKSKEIANSKELKESFKVLDGYSEDYESMQISDVPVVFGKNKKYINRTVHIVPCQTDY